MAQQQQGGQQGGGADNSLDFLWMMVLIIAGLLAAWYFGRVYIAAFVFKLKYFEILAIDAGLSAYTSIAEPIGLPLPDTSSLVAALNIIITGPSADMGFSPRR